MKHILIVKETKMARKTTFAVYKNKYELIREIEGTKVAAKKFIAEYMSNSTHMGEWRKTPVGYVYGTTIGVYFKFIRRRAGGVK